MLAFVSNTGYRCEKCDDGYYEIRAALTSPAAADAAEDVRECARCRCNNNIDSNAVGNCDRYAATSMFASFITLHHVFTVIVSSLKTHFQPFAQRIYFLQLTAEYNNHIGSLLLLLISLVCQFKKLNTYKI